MSEPIVVAGAGLAGLVCARRLIRAGRRVLIIDPDDRPGGRLKTDLVEGFRIDRGFQAWFTAHPHARREVSEARLNLRKFVPGAGIWDGRRISEVRRDDDLAMLLSPLFPFSDKLRVLGLNMELKGRNWAQIWSDEDMPAAELLQRRGFSEPFIERFARPFFGSVFLDRSLSLSSRAFLYVWKMLNEGAIGVPAEGMEAVPRQIAEDIPAASFRFGVRAARLLEEGGQVRGVVLEGGEEIRAEKVVAAADPVAVCRLAGLPVPQGGRSSITVSFDAPEPLGDEPLLLLNGPGQGLVSHVMDMTAASPSCSPPGRRLVAATVIGARKEDDLSLAGAVVSELGAWLPKAGVERWRPLKVNRIAGAQMPQPPGFFEDRPPVRLRPGLILAGEAAAWSSIDGAVYSGIQAARAILQERDEQAA